MSPTFSERKQLCRAQFKRDFRNDRLTEKLAQRDVATALDVTNSHAHSLEDDEGVKNLRADEVHLLPEPLALRTIKRMLGLLKTSYELVLCVDDDSCMPEMESFAKVAKEYSEAIAAWSVHMGKEVNDEQAAQTDRELEEAEHAIARARRTLAGRHAKKSGRATPVNVRPDVVIEATALKSA